MELWIGFSVGEKNSSLIGDSGGSEGRFGYSAVGEGPSSVSSNLFKDTRIIGGNEAPEHRYSYMVSLQGSRGHFCGGSLIAKDMVLTAAHCVSSDGNEDIEVFIGRHDFGDKDGDVVRCKKSKRHPNYKSSTDEYDFALLYLSRPTTANVKLVKLNKQGNFPTVGVTAYTMGWGDTEQKDDKMSFPDELQVVALKVISNDECRNAEGKVGGYSDSYEDYIFDDMMCTFTENKDACQDDSGGPLVIRGEDSNGAGDIQVGVVSWGTGCATKVFPGVFGRVSSAYSWVKSNVCSESDVKPGHLCGTKSPTPNPTKQPTSQPTNPPTRKPTSQPTKKPTNQPTNQPTSTRPTDAPMSLPTDLPSAMPNEHPSDFPSMLPTSSSQPSSSPSNFPTFSMVPSWQPSSFPSFSVQPIFIPSSNPFSSPSSDPTTSSPPSSIPSLSPSKSSEPSSLPSSTPTKKPLASQSSSPMKAPSALPIPTVSLPPTVISIILPVESLLIPVSSFGTLPEDPLRNSNTNIASSMKAGAIFTRLITTFSLIMIMVV